MRSRPPQGDGSCRHPINSAFSILPLLSGHESQRRLLRGARLLCAFGGLLSGSRGRPPPLQAEERAGQPPFDAVRIVNVFVLQAPSNLSDVQPGDQIRDRLSFMRFLGLDPYQRIPDAKPIWLFREPLARTQVVETLFAELKPIWTSTEDNPVAAN